MGNLRINKGSDTQKDGSKAETMVRWYLFFRGYKLLEKNYTVGHKEIDLIMRKKDTIFFIEVKGRRKIDERFPPRMSVDRRKQLNIIAAAKIYLAKNKLRRVYVSFDVAEVDLDKKRIIYIENAFTE